MRFLTGSECRALAIPSTVLEWRADQPDPSLRGARVRCAFPKTNVSLDAFSRLVVEQVTYRQSCMLWVMNSAVWPCNWHLYYRLRQSYGDYRLIGEAPGHYFLDYEGVDLATYFMLAMLNGWDTYLLPRAGYVFVASGHDEFLEFYSDNDSLLEEVFEQMEKRDLSPTRMP